MKRKLKYMNLPLGFSARPRSQLLVFLRFSLAWLILEKIPWLADRLFRLYVDERFVEYPLVHAYLGRERKLRILDIGCWGSRLPIELASLGHEVYGLDIQNYPLEHPNFAFIRGDACQMPFPDKFFDAITAISTIEHISLGRYGDPTHIEGDKKAVREMARTLKSGGRLIVAIPFGGERRVLYQKGTLSYMLYDPTSLKELFSGLGIIRVEYWIKKEEHWRQVPEKEAAEMPSTPTDVRSIAWVVVEKR